MIIPTFQDFLGEMADAAGNQERGICQICGRDQAVRTKGHITHHGYTKKYGWFHGSCPGTGYPPLQTDKSETEHQIGLIKKEIPKIEQVIKDLESGKVHPQKIVVSTFRKETIDWADANEYQRKRAVSIAKMNEEARLRAAHSTIKDLENLIHTFHGQDLRVVKKLPSDAKKRPGVGDVVNIAGKKNVTITKIETRTVHGVSPALNGQSLPHAYWVDPDGRERSYPLKLARWPKA